MENIIENTRSSGRVYLKNNSIFWECPEGETFIIDIAEIAVVGEYTIDHGPFNDDWFLTLVSKDGSWASISWYAENISIVTELLSEKFNVDFDETYLANSTKWKSVVRYPNSLIGKDLFKLTPPNNYKIPITTMQKVKNALGIGVYGKPWEIELTDEVLEFLHACH